MSRITTSSPKSSGTLTPYAQINSQVLSQDWELSSGWLRIFSTLDLNGFNFTVDSTSILEIN